MGRISSQSRITPGHLLHGRLRSRQAGALLPVKDARCRYRTRLIAAGAAAHHRRVMSAIARRRGSQPSIHFPLSSYLSRNRTIARAVSKH